jgi:lipopolysaccharide/colanic/teichoic acid biosynthesis glycosyltransferase
MVEPATPRRTGHYVPVKRLFDFLSAAFALLVLSPLLALVALLVRLDSRGPILYGDKREGLDGVPFRCWKFRSMFTDAAARQRELAEANQMDGPQFKLDHDPRITRLGRILRATNLDELPQLINVLVGEMSLVGPRPSPFRENQLCVPWREARLSVRPGITGLWQVCRHDPGHRRLPPVDLLRPALRPPPFVRPGHEDPLRHRDQPGRQEALRPGTAALPGRYPRGR